MNKIIQLGKYSLMIIGVVALLFMFFKVISDVAVHNAELSIKKLLPTITPEPTETEAVQQSQSVQEIQTSSPRQVQTQVNIEQKTYSKVFFPHQNSTYDCNSQNANAAGKASQAIVDLKAGQTKCVNEEADNKEKCYKTCGSGDSSCRDHCFDNQTNMTKFCYKDSEITSLESQIQGLCK